MTQSKRSLPLERGSSSRSAGKRKLDDDQADSPSRSSKHRKSIIEPPHPPRNTVHADDHEVFISPGKQGKRGKLRRVLTSLSSAAPNPTFAEMYHFEPSKPKNGTVIDLTDSKDSPKRKGIGLGQPRAPAFNPHQGPKKLTVKNLRTTPRVDPEKYFEKVWEQQDTSLTASFNDEKIPYSLEELYKGAEHVCRQGKAAELYKRLTHKCENHLAGPVTDHLRVTVERSASDINVLKSFVDSWSKWQRQLLTIRQIFYYMDQTYLLRSSTNPSLTDTGLLLFRANVFANAQLKQKVMNGVVDLIDDERRSRISHDDSAFLRRAIDTLHELTIYTSDFEPVFGASSDKHFRNWRVSVAESSDLAYYAGQCTSLLEKEMARCDLLVLDRSTRAQLSQLFDTIFVEERVNLLTQEDSIIDLLEDDKYAEVEQVFSLLQRKAFGEKVGPIFDKYVINEGSAIVFDEKREADMVVRLLDFKRRLDHFHKFSFHKNDLLGNGLHKSFEHFINKTKKSQANWDTDNAKPGEMIAKHVDLLLKGGIKAVPKLASTKSGSSKIDEEHDFDELGADEDAEISAHLSDALDLFRFVHGKAVFEAFYKKDLARRLLMGRSASDDAERNMLRRLKNECGASFTHNLESMFKDMDLARDEMFSYNQLLEERGSKTLGPDLHVNVLSAAAWPTYPDVPVSVPASILKVQKSFQDYYMTKHTGRKLDWKDALAHCQLRSKFAKGNKEIVVSGFQAVVLLLFNDVSNESTLSYNDIKAASGLSDAELKRTLQSLACAKYRVLTKTPKGREVNTSDQFAVNVTFSDPKLRIKINQIQLKETKEENKETHVRIAKDRQFETQAAIVRIMKGAKKIPHNNLIVEVIKATRSRGVLEQQEIRKEIEKLIEKEYMERIDGTNTYSYVA